MANSAWDQADDAISDKGKGKGSNNFPSADLYMKVGNGEHQFRIVGEPKPVWNVWFNKKKYQVPNIPAYLEKVKELVDQPVRKNIVVNVIDREDQKKRAENGQGPRFKLLEKGSSIFDNIIAHYKENLDEDGQRIPPGGPKGQDWKVIAKIPANDPRNARYQVISKKITPFSAEEKKLIARTEKHELVKTLLKKEEYDKIVESKYWEKFRDLPLGEKGLIDLDSFYNEERAQKKLDELFAELTGEEVVIHAEPKAKPKAASAVTDDFDDFDVADEKPAKSTKVEEPASTASEVEDLEDLF